MQLTSEPEHKVIVAECVHVALDPHKIQSLPEQCETGRKSCTHADRPATEQDIQDEATRVDLGHQRKRTRALVFLPLGAQPLLDVYRQLKGLRADWHSRDTACDDSLRA